MIYYGYYIYVVLGSNFLPILLPFLRSMVLEYGIQHLPEKNQLVM